MHVLNAAAAAIVALCLVAGPATAQTAPIPYKGILPSSTINQMIADIAATKLGMTTKLDGAAYVTIKSGGAKCDGVTDDTAAINAVLAANRVVFIPAGTGTCMVAGTLNVVLDHSVLAGPGLDSATIKATNASLPVVKVAVGLTQVTLSGFSVDRSVPAVSGGK